MPALARDARKVEFFGAITDTTDTLSLDSAACNADGKLLGCLVARAPAICFDFRTVLGRRQLTFRTMQQAILLTHLLQLHV